MRRLGSLAAAVAMLSAFPHSSIQEVEEVGRARPSKSRRSYAPLKDPRPKRPEKSASLRRLLRKSKRL